MNFKTKISISILSTGLLSIALLVSVSIFYNVRHIKSLTVKMGSELTISGARVLSGYFETRKAEMAAYASMPLFKSMDWERIGPFLKQEEARHGGIYEKMLLEYAFFFVAPFLLQTSYFR